MESFYGLARTFAQILATVALAAVVPHVLAAGPAATVTPEVATCVARWTIALDDATSSPDIIALAVRDKCRPELTAAQAGDAAFNERLMPVLTASVIVYRAQVRQRGPEKPLSPLPNAPARRAVVKPST